VLAGEDRLREAEINPLRAMPKGREAIAVDALVLLNEAEVCLRELKHERFG
jgi:succinyl-CoA synthetase beta subunit